MKLRGLCLLLMPMVVAANPLGSIEDPRTWRIDPFHGSWKCVGCKSWDEKGKETDRKEQGFVLRFDRDRVVVLNSANAPGDEHLFRTLNPKSFSEGKIDILDKGGTDPLRACYRFSEGRFFLCLMEDDEKVRPTRCGPGKKHMLYEFVPYQPKRLVQSHFVESTEPEKKQ